MLAAAAHETSFAAPRDASGDSVPSERPKRHDHQRKRDNDERDSDEISINGRRIPEGHGDVLLGRRVAPVQDQEQPDQTEKRCDKQADEPGRDLHDRECTSVAARLASPERREPGARRPERRAPVDHRVKPFRGDRKTRRPAGSAHIFLGGSSGNVTVLSDVRGF
jgi:hypothetical protein